MFQYHKAPKYSKLCSVFCVSILGFFAKTVEFVTNHACTYVSVCESIKEIHKYLTFITTNVKY